MNHYMLLMILGFLPLSIGLAGLVFRAAPIGVRGLGRYLITDYRARLYGILFLLLGLPMIVIGLVGMFHAQSDVMTQNLINPELTTGGSLLFWVWLVWAVMLLVVNVMATYIIDRRERQRPATE